MHICLSTVILSHLQVISALHFIGRARIYTHYLVKLEINFWKLLTSTRTAIVIEASINTHFGDISRNVSTFSYLHILEKDFI
jgi:hypothetical protein